MQYPPAVNITKQTNGSFIYSGTSFDVIDYVAEALNIRLGILSMYDLESCFTVTKNIILFFPVTQ